MKKILMITTLMVTLAIPALADRYHSASNDQTQNYRLVKLNDNYRDDGRPESRRYQDNVLAMLRRVMPRIDANGDGLIDQDEYNAFHGANFAQADKDRDGVLTFDELFNQTVSNRDQLASIERVRNTLYN